MASTPPARNIPALNCLLNRLSPDQKRRMSGTSKSTIAALETESEGPRALIAEASLFQDLHLHHAATEHLEPLPLEEDLELHGGPVKGKYASTQRISTSPNG